MNKRFKAPQEPLPPLYYKPFQIVCKCGHVVIEEQRNMHDHFMTFFCANQDCDQYQQSKKLDFPVITEYQLI